MFVCKLIYLLPAVLLLIGCCAAMAQEETPKKTLRLLTVGNSFADNATKYLRQIAEAGGYQLEFTKANLAGCSLETHWKHVARHEADPTDPLGMPFKHPETGAKIGLKELLALQQWDFITIQQASIDSDQEKTYRPFAKNLYDFIKVHAPQAEVLVYQTWAYRCDDPGLAQVQMTDEAMYQALTANYRAIANELGARLIPVGDAFHLATISTDFAYTPDQNYDFAHPEYPHKPNTRHSLHYGWYWSKNQQTGEQKQELDTHHAGSAGEYLAGLVFFEMFTGQSTIGNSYVPPGISKDDAAILQKYAHQAVRDRQLALATK